MLDLVVMAPFPSVENERDGKMQRVRAIDKLFNENRLYVNLSKRGGYVPKLKKISDDVYEFHANLFLYSFFIIICLLVVRPKIYVHTVVEAVKVLPICFLLRRIVLDLHGVVPEEMLLGGYSNYSKLFNIVERLFYNRACMRVHVTRKMYNHYIKKYGDKKNDIILPIFSLTTNNYEDIKQLNAKPIVIYAGGIQPWQCIDEIISFSKNNCNDFDIRLFFSDVDALYKKYNLADFDSRVSISTAPYDKIQEQLLSADLGIVIRKNITVNEVACPTKLIEYLNNSVVPILGDCEIGDFVDIGMKYFHYKDEIKADLISQYKVENGKVINKLNELSASGKINLETFIKSI